MSFTTDFEAKPVGDKAQFAIDERLRRVKTHLDQYVAIPIAVPKMAKTAPTPIDFTLGWAIGVPGKQENEEGKPARAALTLGFPDEDTAEDFCHILNWARQRRKMEASGEYRS